MQLDIVSPFAVDVGIAASVSMLCGLYGERSDYYKFVKCLIYRFSQKCSECKTKLALVKPAF